MPYYITSKLYDNFTMQIKMANNKNIVNDRNMYTASESDELIIVSQSAHVCINISFGNGELTQHFLLTEWIATNG